MPDQPDEPHRRRPHRWPSHRPYRAVADGGRGMLADLGSGSMVDELIVERRAAAAAEDAAVDFSAAPSREEVGP